MSLSRGEEFAVGVSVEAVRGTFVIAQDYVRGREPSTIQTISEKADIKETKSTGVATQDTVVTMQKVEGDLALNLRFRTIGYFLKSLLGGVSSSLEGGETVVYRHTITLDTAILQPTLSLSLAKGGLTHKEINGSVVSKLGLSFSTDDVINGSVSILGLTETDASDFTPSFASDDALAPHQMLTVKIASTVAGLSGATAICITQAEFELDRGTDSKLCVSSINPVDFLAKLLSISGKFTWEKTDDTYFDLAIANTPQALQFDIVNTNESIGVGSNPTLTVQFPKVTLVTTENRSLEDVVTEDVEFVAHYDDTEAKAITISLLNEKADYNAT
ncbi:MAG: hypothetical protein KAS07_02860 [Candidatus Pacebacteria bacterium]|nr:hypothetical protein [Candidatus Paceibacterota bacterium]